MISIRINNKTIGMNSPAFIIAEIGVNHNGDIELGKKLIDIASKAKVDAVKFQTFKSEELMLENTPKVEYQKKNTKDDENLFDIIKKCELTKKDFIILKDYALKKDLIFLSTPYDKSSIELLENINVPLYKVSSGDLNNYLLLNEIAKTRKPIIISTGMATMKEIRNTVAFLKEKEVRNLIIMQCTTNYPAKFNELNLNVLRTFKKEFPDHIIGFSDHSLGFIASVSAVAMGAKIIEKHITLDKNLDGPDHKASLDPKELVELVKSIRKIEKALGSYIKEPSNIEKEHLKLGRKSIVLKKALRAGEELTEDNITVKRPSGGISPENYYKIIGKRLKIDKSKNSILNLEDIYD